MTTSISSLGEQRGGFGAKGHEGKIARSSAPPQRLGDELPFGLGVDVLHDVPRWRASTPSRESAGASVFPEMPTPLAIAVFEAGDRDPDVSLRDRAGSRAKAMLSE